jgi:hypothetical protein
MADPNAPPVLPAHIEETSLFGAGGRALAGVALHSRLNSGHSAA